MSNEARNYLLELNSSGLRVGRWLGPVTAHKTELVNLGVMTISNEGGEEPGWTEFEVTEAGQLIIDQVVAEQ